MLVRLLKWASLVITTGFGILAFLAQVGPRDVKQNIADWLQWWATDDLVQWLLAPRVNALSLLAILFLFLCFSPWIYRQLKAQISKVDLHAFLTSDPTYLKYTVGISVDNLTAARLDYCTVRIEDIEPSEPDSIYWVFSDSPIKLRPAVEEVFALNPRDHRKISIAQYDSGNQLSNLGIELLCYGAKAPAVDTRQSYTLTLATSCQQAPPLQKQFKLYIDDLGVLRLEPIPRFTIFGRALKLLSVPFAVNRKFPATPIESPPEPAPVAISHADDGHPTPGPDEQQFTKGEVAIEVFPGTGQQSLCARFKNMTPRALHKVAYFLSDLQRWSDAQKTLLTESKPFEPICLAALSVLEPEIPEGFEIFSNRANQLYFSGTRGGRHDSFTVQTDTNAAWRIVLSVKVDGQVVNDQQIFFRAGDSNKLNQIDDPRVT